MTDPEDGRIARRRCSCGAPASFGPECVPCRWSREAFERQCASDLKPRALVPEVGRMKGDEFVGEDPTAAAIADVLAKADGVDHVTVDDKTITITFEPGAEFTVQTWGDRGGSGMHGAHVFRRHHGTPSDCEPAGNRPVIDIDVDEVEGMAAMFGGAFIDLEAGVVRPPWRRENPRKPHRADVGEIVTHPSGTRLFRRRHPDDDRTFIDTVIDIEGESDVIVDPTWGPSVIERVWPYLRDYQRDVLRDIVGSMHRDTEAARINATPAIGFVASLPEPQPTTKRRRFRPFR